MVRYSLLQQTIGYIFCKCIVSLALIYSLKFHHIELFRVNVVINTLGVPSIWLFLFFCTTNRFWGIILGWPESKLNSPDNFRYKPEQTIKCTRNPFSSCWDKILGQTDRSPLHVFLLKHFMQRTHKNSSLRNLDSYLENEKLFNFDHGWNKNRPDVMLSTIRKKIRKYFSCNPRP